MATRFGDDEDAVSLEGSSFNDLYVKAPLENTQVGSCDPPKLLRGLTTILGHTHTFSNGGGTDSYQRSSKLFTYK